MSTTQEKLDQLELDKLNIKTAIEGKKGDVLVEPDNLGTYAVEIDNLPTVVDDGWERPLEWVDLPEVNLNNEQKAVMLFLIRDDVDYDSIAFSVTSTSTVTIDWGDGNVQDVGNGKVIHDYDFNSISSDLTIEGHKQCVCTVTSTGNITNMSFYNQSNSAGEYSIGFVEGVFSLQELTSTSSMFHSLYACQSLTMGDFSNSTNTSGMFRNLYACQSFAIGDFSNSTNTSAMFMNMYTCPSLTVGDFSNSTNTSYMFYGMYACPSLTTGDFSSSTSTSSMFMYMYACQSLSVGDFSSSTNTSNMFYNMSACQSLTFATYVNNIEIKNIGLSYNKLLVLINNLEVVAEQKTLTLTGARGASSLTAEDLQVAIDKNWLVVT